VNQINELQGITQSGTRKTPESPNTLDEYDFYQLGSIFTFLDIDTSASAFKS